MPETRLSPYPFPNLNLSVLRMIAKHWVTDYKEKGLNIAKITIHPRGMPISLKEVLSSCSDSRKYVVIFYCPDCTRDDLPSANDSAKEHLKKLMNDEFSPYYDLYMATSGNCDNNSILFYSSFPDVYMTHPKENWVCDWQFIMKYQEATIPADVWKETGEVLYPAPLLQDKPFGTELEPSVDDGSGEEKKTPPIESQLDEFLIGLKDDLPIFYNAVVNETGNRGILQVCKEDFSGALEETKWDRIQLSFFDDIKINNPQRDIQGTIIKEIIINEKKQCLFKVNGIGKNKQKLFERFQELIKM